MQDCLKQSCHGNLLLTDHYTIWLSMFYLPISHDRPSDISEVVPE